MRYFLAVAQHGRLTGAANRLGVDHTTVGRRITALEKSAGQRLFERAPAGWRLTEAGHQLLAPAEAIAVALATAEERLGSTSAGLSGSVRIVCPDGFGGFLLAPSLGELTRSHPDLQIELLTSSPFMAHTLSEFDVGIVQRDLRSSRVRSRRLTDYRLGFYASEDYLRDHPMIETLDDLKDHVTIWYLESLLSVPQLQAVVAALPPRVRVRSTNIVTHWQAAANGVGVAPMPHFVATQDSRLVRVLQDTEFTSSYWVASPVSHSRLARVRAIEAHLDELVERHRPQLFGYHFDAKRTAWPREE